MHFFENCKIKRFEKVGASWSSGLHHRPRHQGSAVQILVSPLFSILIFKFVSEEQGNLSMGRCVYDGSVATQLGDGSERRERKRKAGATNHGGTGRRTWKEDVKLARAIEPVRWREHLKRLLQSPNQEHQKNSSY